MGIYNFYPLDKGESFRLWFRRTTPNILFFSIQCMILVWVCVLHGMIKKNKDKKILRILKIALLWILGIFIILVLAIGILLCSIRNDDSEIENSDGTITLEKPIFLDPPRYYLYEKENFLILRYLKELDRRPDNTDISVKPKEDLEVDDREDTFENQEELERIKKIEEGYKKIYEAYFKDSLWEYKLSYNAKGNSYVIVFEDKNQIKYLVYDKQDDTGKYASYVYYQNDKGTDGSWNLIDAKILDIYEYNLNSKEVKDLKKTSW